MLRLVVLLGLLLVACGEGGPRVVLPANVPLEVHLLGTTSQPQNFNIHPADPKYQRFKGWLERNADGWYQFYATPPNSGILINAEALRLQFIGTRALVTTDDGVYEKSVQVSDYAYLTAY